MRELSDRTPLAPDLADLLDAPAASPPRHPNRGRGALVAAAVTAVGIAGVTALTARGERDEPALAAPPTTTPGQRCVPATDIDPSAHERRAQPEPDVTGGTSAPDVVRLETEGGISVETGRDDPGNPRCFTPDLALTETQVDALIAYLRSITGAEAPCGRRPGDRC